MEHSPLSTCGSSSPAYIEECRRQPRDDVMTGLATATFPDGTLPPVEDVMKIAANLFAAGQETTARLLSTALQAIGDRPELQQQLRDDRGLVPAFIEEMLRLESPIKGTFRLSRVPTTVGGTEIPAGSTVMVLPGAANRDPREFERPGRAAARPAERPPAHRLRPRHPHLRRRAAGPGRGQRVPPAAARPDGGHPDLRGAPRPGRRPPLASTRPLGCSGAWMSSTSSSLRSADPTPMTGPMGAPCSRVPRSDADDGRADHRRRGRPARPGRARPLRVERGYPHELWARLRAEAPVAYLSRAGYEPFWAVTRHADIVDVASQPERFSSAHGLILGREGSAAQPSEMVVTLDPPRHGPLRRAAMPRFTPRAIRSRHEEIDRITVEVLDEPGGHGRRRRRSTSSSGSPRRCRSA